MAIFKKVFDENTKLEDAYIEFCVDYVNQIKDRNNFKIIEDEETNQTTIQINIPQLTKNGRIVRRAVHTKNESKILKIDEINKIKDKDKNKGVV